MYKFFPGIFKHNLQVIDCYINLIKAQKHLKCRSGGRVHIENAFQFNFVKRDGDVEIKTDELYPIEDMTQICSAERRVLLYLDHDIVHISLQSEQIVFICNLFLCKYL
jgi:sentrin-specific protease 1